LESTVLGLVGPSTTVAAHFTQPLDLLFIDGGHGHDVAWADYEAWTPKVVDGRAAADPRRLRGSPPTAAGRPTRSTGPRSTSGNFVDVASEGSLRALRASLAPGQGTVGFGEVEGHRQFAVAEEPRGPDEDVSASAARMIAAAVYDVVSRGGTSPRSG
jgi:hypothetical protein